VLAVAVAAWVVPVAEVAAAAIVVTVVIVAGVLATVEGEAASAATDEHLSAVFF
jgi:negative regulator of sigma E activity